MFDVQANGRVKRVGVLVNYGCRRCFVTKRKGYSKFRKQFVKIVENKKNLVMMNKLVLVLQAMLGLYLFGVFVSGVSKEKS